MLTLYFYLMYQVLLYVETMSNPKYEVFKLTRRNTSNAVINNHESDYQFKDQVDMST